MPLTGAILICKSVPLVVGNLALLKPISGRKSYKLTNILPVRPFKNSLLKWPSYSMVVQTGAAIMLHHLFNLLGIFFIQLKVNLKSECLLSRSNTKLPLSLHHHLFRLLLIFFQWVLITCVHFCYLYWLCYSYVFRFPTEQRVRPSVVAISVNVDLLS